MDSAWIIGADEIDGLEPEDKALLGLLLRSVADKCIASGKPVPYRIALDLARVERDQGGTNVA